MAEHLKFERFFWFDRQVRRGLYPNAHTLARQFELSDKTAQRTIDFMEERLGAPLEYDPSRRGYRYTDDRFSLPSLEVSQNEMLAVLIAQNLLAGAACGVISRSIRSFGRKLFAATGDLHPPPGRGMAGAAKRGLRHLPGWGAPSGGASFHPLPRPLAAG